MNYVRNNSPSSANGWGDNPIIKKLKPAGMNFVKHYTGIGPLLKVPNHLTATHLEKEVDSHTGKTNVKVPLTTTEKLGLAAGELFVGCARLIPLIAIPVAPGCYLAGLQESNSICEKATLIANLEWKAVGIARWLVQQGISSIAPLANGGFELARLGMTEPRSFVVTHLALLGSGTYLLNSAWKDYKESPLSVSRLGKITLTRQSNTLRANVSKIATIAVKGAVGVSLIGVSLGYIIGFISPAIIPPATNTTLTTNTTNTTLTTNATVTATATVPPPPVGKKA